MNAEQDTPEIGFRFYHLGYLEDLLKTKVGEIGFPWAFVESKLLPVAKRFFENGLFVIRVLDDGNSGYCDAAFLKNNSVDIKILIMCDNGKMILSQNAENKIRFLCPPGVRRMFKQDAQANEQTWTPELENFVTKLVDKFYSEKLFFACADTANTVGLHELLKVEFDVDLKLRLG